MCENAVGRYRGDKVQLFEHELQESHSQTVFRPQEPHHNRRRQWFLQELYQRSTETRSLQDPWTALWW